MKSLRSFSIVAVASAFFATSCLPAFAAPAAASAVLHSTGTVNVNGAAVKSSTAIFAGDHIATLPGAGATLSLDGSSVLVEANSELTYSNLQVQLRSGTASIRTEKALSAGAGDVSAAPVSASGRYAVSIDHRNITVAALEGAVSVHQGTRAFSVPAGTRLTLLCASCEKESADPAPASPQTGGTAPAGSTGTSSTQVTTGVIIGVSGATAAGVGSAIAAGQKKSSPSIP